MIEYIQSHQSGFWITAGFILLAAEALVFGFATIILLFAGIGALVTGLLMAVGVLPETWIAGVASFGLSTGIVSILLWKPMRRLQNDNVSPQSNSSDLIGYGFVLQEDISPMSSGSHRYSGVDWKVELDANAGVDSLPAGQRVTVVSVDAGIFRVKAA
ncbi:MAG: NfeD family protein [Gammaproteobacteria bacterium]|nr:NfeD family protein [Gammaproteobacteria bacterium]